MSEAGDLIEYKNGVHTVYIHRPTVYMCDYSTQSYLIRTSMSSLKIKFKKYL